jgi:hypothetical protein
MKYAGNPVLEYKFEPSFHKKKNRKKNLLWSVSSSIILLFIPMSSYASLCYGEEGAR